ncbi:UNVERIFIED_CONTAM: two-component system sensor histidine kinase YesM [Brevibacillus sp. OAP136]
MCAIFRFFKRMIELPQKSIHAKLILFFLIVAIIPLLMLGTLSYRQSADIINTQFGNYGQYVVTQLQFQIDSSLSQMQIIAHDINTYLLDPTLIVLREEIPRTYNGFLAQKNFERYLEAHRTLEMQGIYLITQSGYYYGRNRLDVEKLRKEQWWQDIPTKLDGEYWIGFYEPHHSLGADEPHGTRNMLGLVVPVKSSYGVLKQSRILLEMDAEKLFHLFELLERDMKATIVIRDGQGQTMYKSATDRKQAEDDIVWTQQLETSGWSIEVRVPYEQYYRSSNVIGTLTLLTVGICLLLVLLLAYLLSHPITRRIKRLKESMRLVGTGELMTRTAVDSQDELGNLAEHFNQMVVQLQRLVEEVGRTEQLKKEAELRAFHYQINPHLLFNTLNSIQWQARLSGANEINDMLYHLIMVLEGNLDFTQELVTLERELQTLRHYLAVQEIRYGDNFRFLLDMEEGVGHCLIPRMSLQPLFENIFFHAFEDGQGTIHLQVKDGGDCICLILNDDGAGIPEDKMSSMLKPQQARSGKGGLGMQNVDQKFKLHFGADYGLDVRSVRGEGTTVQVKWPKREELSHAG